MAIRRWMKRCVMTWVVGALALAAIAPGAMARKGYISSQGATNAVTAFDTDTNALVGAAIPVGASPESMAITPDATRVFVPNRGSANVSVIDAQTGFAGGPIAVGTTPTHVAITPDGTRAYVSNGNSNTVSVINTQTNAVVGSPITVGTFPFGIAIAPDGTRAYVANSGGGANSVSVINTQTNTVVGSPITVGTQPQDVAITPDGRRAYVVNFGSNNVSVIDTATNTVVGSPIAVGFGAPDGIAITPDGSRVYVARQAGDSVVVIDTQTNTLIGSPIAAGSSPQSMAITPDGKRLYVRDLIGNQVAVIDTQTNTNIGSVTVTTPGGVAITPDQPPKASLKTTPKRLVATLDAGGSTDVDGQIATYSWDFGDGATAQTTTPTVSHTYPRVGEFTAKVTATDNEGCSGRLVFTGTTAYCSASALSSATRMVATFTLGKLKRNKHNGTAKLAVNVPGRGTLSLSGKGAVKQRMTARPAKLARTVNGAGTVKLKIKAKGKKKRQLLRRGKTKLRLTIVFTPTTGDPNTQTKRVKLVKRP